MRNGNIRRPKPLNMILAHAVATEPWPLLVAERERLAVQFAEVCGVTAAMRLGDREHGRTDMPRVLENRAAFSEACRFQQHTSRWCSELRQRRLLLLRFSSCCPTSRANSRTDCIYVGSRASLGTASGRISLRSLSSSTALTFPL
jgi:hypothetical protein